MGGYEVALLGGSSKVLPLVPWGQGREVRAYPPACSHTLRCQWSQWRRWQCCPHARSGPGVAGLPAPQCSSLGPGGGYSAAWHSSLPTCPFGTHDHPQFSVLKCALFSESSERLSRTRYWRKQPVPMWGRHLVEKPRLDLPPYSCPCPSMRCPSPPPPIHLGQFAICSTSPAPLSVPAAHSIPGLLTISVCFWLM